MFYMSEFMNYAINEAKAAYIEGEIPIGAVIVENGKVVSSAHNLCEKLSDPTAHAEMLAIKEACRKLDRKFLDGCEMYVTVEPCPMCAGAVINSRISRLYFGAFEPQTGACGSVVNLFLGTDAYKKTDVFTGDCEKEAQKLMKDFFASRLR